MSTRESDSQSAIADAPTVEDELAQRVVVRAHFWSTALRFCFTAGSGGMLLYYLLGSWFPTVLGVPLALISAALVMLCPFLYVVSYYAGARADLLKRQRDAPALSEALFAVLDGPPVLYLRSFYDDSQAARLAGRLTEEEHLANVVGQLGHFVAIGRPQEQSSHVGATRVYLPDETWQHTLAQQFATAGLVIVRTGISPGLDWELQTLAITVPPERVILMVDDDSELNHVLGVLRRVHPQIPNDVKLGARSGRSIRGFVAFDADWQTLPMPARGAGWYLLCEREINGNDIRTTMRFANTLRPLLRRAGVRWNRPPLDYVFIASSVLPATFLLLWAIVEIVLIFTGRRSDSVMAPRMLAPW